MSWQASVANGVLRLVAKRGDLGPEGAQQALDKSRARPPKVPPSAKAVRDLTVSDDSSSGMPVYDLRPSTGEPGRRIFYLHGGSYTFEISPFHWRFLGELARSAPAHITVPIYPLAPETTAASTVSTVTDLLEQYLGAHPDERIVLMGDSAGGGMSLAVAEQLRDRGKQPAQIVLLSPWLDVTMSDPRQPAIEPKDRMLGLAALAYYGGCYAGALDVRDPRVSPLYGDLTGLAPIDVFIGTHDVLWIDALRLAEEAKKHGATVRLHEAPSMQHAYPILPFLPEARAAQREIVSLVRG